MDLENDGNDVEENRRMRRGPYGKQIMIWYGPYDIINMSLRLSHIIFDINMWHACPGSDKSNRGETAEEGRGGKRREEEGRGGRRREEEGGGKGSRS